MLRELNMKQPGGQFSFQPTPPSFLHVTCVKIRTKVKNCFNFDNIRGPLVSPFTTPYLMKYSYNDSVSRLCDHQLEGLIKQA